MQQLFFVPPPPPPPAGPAPEPPWFEEAAPRANGGAHALNLDPHGAPAGVEMASGFGGAEATAGPHDAQHTDIVFGNMLDPGRGEALPGGAHHAWDRGGAGGTGRARLPPRAPGHPAAALHAPLPHAGVVPGAHQRSAPDLPTSRLSVETRPAVGGGGSGGGGAAMGGEADAGARADESQAGPSPPDGPAGAPPARQASAPASANDALAARGHIPVPRRSPFADGDAVRPHAQRRWHVASERCTRCVVLCSCALRVCLLPSRLLLCTSWRVPHAKRRGRRAGPRRVRIKRAPVACLACRRAAWRSAARCPQR